MYAENSVFVEDLEKHFNIAQRFIEEWTDIFIRIEALGSQYSSLQVFMMSCVMN